MYVSTKTYGHEAGFTAVFRQHRAQSHCRFLHGYALAFRLEFECDDDALDVRNWAVDFGSLKSFKGVLEDTFDHKLVVAQDDPELNSLVALEGLGLAELVIVEATGCEAFAKLVFDYGEIWLKDNGYSPRVRMRSVECREHAGNSAIYLRDQSPVEWTVLECSDSPNAHVIKGTLEDFDEGITRTSEGSK